MFTLLAKKISVNGQRGGDSASKLRHGLADKCGHGDQQREHAKNAESTNKEAYFRPGILSGMHQNVRGASPKIKWRDIGPPVQASHQHGGEHQDYVRRNGRKKDRLTQAALCCFDRANVIFLSGFANELIVRLPQPAG